MTKYKHRDSDMIVEAERYSPGQEDGFADPDRKFLYNTKRLPHLVPYVMAIRNGFLEPVMLTENDYIIHYKNQILVFNEDLFERFYSEVSNGNIKRAN